MYLYRVRVSFPGETRSLLETGRAMARWAEAAVRILAPELSWESVVEEHADFELARQWQQTHVVRLSGAGDDGTERGRGESRLRAGGKGSRIGGTGRVVVRAVGPARQLVADNHCDVTHWDVSVGPIDREGLDRMIGALEEELGAEAQLSAAREDEAAIAPQVLVPDCDPEDAALWLRDLAEVGLTPRRDGDALWIESAALPDVDALEAARVTLGEILSEAGHDDWEERALEILLRLPPG